jgi:hypothetical protein
MVATLLFVAVQAQAAWQPITTLVAEGDERLANGTTRHFRISRSGDATAIETSVAVDGQLAGVPRTELKTSKGRLTWLVGKDRWAIEQHRSGVLDYEKMLAPPVFTRSEMSRGAVTLQRVLGQKVEVGRPEAIAGRNCDVLRLADRSAISKTLWIDRQTGATLKYEESVAGQPFIVRQFTAFDTTKQPDARDLSAPDSAKRLWAPVSPGVLQWTEASRGPKGYAEDLATCRKQTKLSASGWILGLPEVPGFDYMITERRESLGSLPKPANEAEGSSVAGTAELKILDSNIARAQQAIELTVAVSKLQGQNSQEQGIVFTLDRMVLEMAADVETPARDKERAAGANGFVQSDFLDAKTGDTLSFVQLRNNTLATAMRGISLPEAVTEKIEGLTNPRVYNVASPKLTILQWSLPSGDYALISTRHSVKELAEIARKANRR